MPDSTYIFVQYSPFSIAGRSFIFFFQAPTWWPPPVSLNKRGKNTLSGRVFNVRFHCKYRNAFSEHHGGNLMSWRTLTSAKKWAVDIIGQSLLAWMIHFQIRRVSGSHRCLKFTKWASLLNSPPVVLSIWNWSSTDHVRPFLIHRSNVHLDGPIIHHAVSWLEGNYTWYSCDNKEKYFNGNGRMQQIRSPDRTPSASSPWLSFLNTSSLLFPLFLIEHSKSKQQHIPRPSTWCRIRMSLCSRLSRFHRQCGHPCWYYVIRPKENVIPSFPRHWRQLMSDLFFFSWFFPNRLLFCVPPRLFTSSLTNRNCPQGQ